MLGGLSFAGCGGEAAEGRSPSLAWGAKPPTQEFALANPPPRPSLQEKNITKNLCPKTKVLAQRKRFELLMTFPPYTISSRAP